MPRNYRELLQLVTEPVDRRARRRRLRRWRAIAELALLSCLYEKELA